MKNDEDDKPPGRSTTTWIESGTMVMESPGRERVLAPLMKSLGWELASIGAEFPDEADSRKSSGWMRNLFGRQAAT